MQREDINPFRLRQYKVIARISVNKTETLYRAYDTVLERDVALKVLAAEYTNDSNLIADFFRNARMAARISHPNMVQVYDLSEEDNKYFITTEFIDGINLHKDIEENGKMPLSKIIPIIIDICQLLQYAWEKEQVIHGDISTKYILLTSTQPKLNHLFLRNFMNDANSDYHKKHIHFSSPEKILDKSLDCRSDIYQLGIVLYKATTGKYPFDGKDSDEIAQSHLHNIAPNARKGDKSLPSQFTVLIDKMLAKHPDNRYPNYIDLTKDLKSLLNDFDNQQRNIFKRIFYFMISPSIFISWFLAFLVLISFVYIVYIKSTQNIETKQQNIEAKYEYDTYQKLEEDFSQEDLSEPALLALQKRLDNFRINHPLSRYNETINTWYKQTQELLIEIIKINKGKIALHRKLNHIDVSKFEDFHIEYYKRDILAQVITQTFNTNKFANAKLILIEGFIFIPFEYRSWRNNIIDVISNAEKIYNFIEVQRLNLYNRTIIQNGISYVITEIKSGVISLTDKDDNISQISYFELPEENIKKIIINSTLYSDAIINIEYSLACFFLWSKKYEKSLNVIIAKSQQEEFYQLVELVSKNSIYRQIRISTLIRDIDYFIELNENRKAKKLWLIIQRFVDSEEYNKDILHIRRIEQKIRGLTKI